LYGLFEPAGRRLKIPSFDQDFAIGNSLFINLNEIGICRATPGKKNWKRKQTESETKNSESFVEGNPPSLLVN